MRSKRNGNHGGVAVATIYDSIGGENALRAIVDGTYVRILGDVVLGPFFAGADMRRVKNHQVAYFSQLLGGPGNYKGPDMQRLHVRMRIEQRHFDRFLQHLVATMKSLKVDDSTIEDVVAVIQPQAKDIVNTESSEDSLAADNKEALIFRQIVENSPINIMRSDNDFVIRYINEASKKTLRKIEHLLPCKVEEVVGTSVDLFHKNPSYQRKILSDPKNLPHHANIQLGPEILSLFVSPIYDAEQKYLGAMVTWDVVTEKVKLEALNADYAGQILAIRRSREVIEFNIDGTVISANESFLKTFGYTEEEIKGKHHSIFVDETWRQSNEYKEFWAKLNRGEFISDEFKNIGKGGKEIWLAAIYNPIADASGKIAKVVTFATDITQQKMTNADCQGQLAAIRKSLGIIEFNMDGTVITANDNFLKVLG
jgi:PAS domain S-box-containing protein